MEVLNDYISFYIVKITMIIDSNEVTARCFKSMRTALKKYKSMTNL